MENNMYEVKLKDKSINEQVASIKTKCSNFKVTFTRLSLKAIGELQPTARSKKYTVEIKYHFKHQPKIRVLNPTLIVNFTGEKIPHVYPGNTLCLHYPKYHEFVYSDYISKTIIPWTSL